MRRLSSGKFIRWMLCLVAMQLPAYAEERAVLDTTGASGQEEVPDEELLEFLAEFGTTDETIFEVIIYHGVEDAAMPIKQADKRSGHE